MLFWESLLVIFVWNIHQNRKSYQKLIFKGDKYTIIADLNAVYLRIQNKEGKYIKLNGAVGSDSETHFKIMNREEMENAHSLN